jgi:hypothetical protein
MNIKDKFLTDLQAGKFITKLDGLELYSTLNIGLQVLQLRREGHDIRTMMCHNLKTGKRYGKYYLIAEGVRRAF